MNIMGFDLGKNQFSGIRALTTHLLCHKGYLLSLKLEQFIEHHFSFDSINMNCLVIFTLFLNQCHGLWDEDDTRSEAKKTLYNHSDSDTEKPPVQRERSSLTRSTLTEATSARIPRKLSNTPSTMRRHSSSAGSHISQRSMRSRGG